MDLSRRILLGVTLSAFAFMPHQLKSQTTWPTRTVKILAAAPAGGSPDIVARLLSEMLAAKWKVSVIVENRPGADGAIAVRALAHSDDDHTLLLAPSGMMTITPVLREDSFKLNDVAPLTQVAADFLVFAVPSSAPHQNIHELISAARSNAGGFNWFAPAGLPAVVFKDFISRTGIQATFVPYKGGPDALRDLSENRIQAMIVPLAVVQPAIEAGKVRLLAVTNEKRFPGLPAIPTMAELGFADSEFEGVLGMFAPKSMPAEIRTKISADISFAVLNPDFQQRLLKMGLKSASGADSNFRLFLENQQLRWGAAARTHSRPVD